MALTNDQKMFIIVVLVVILAGAVYYKCQKRTPVATNAEHMESVGSEDSGSSDSDSESRVVPASTVSDSVDSGTSSASAVTAGKLVEINRGKNANRTETRKAVSYADNTYAESLDAPGKVDARGGSGDIDRFFMDGDVDNAAENREFAPHDEVSDKLAAYVAKKTDEGLLPVEEKDWFEDVTPTRIKNRHLINIYRPVGVNTVSTSLKNPSLDIRGNPPNPKTVVSPFLNSSIEPDHNIRGLCVD